MIDRVMMSYVPDVSLLVDCVKPNVSKVLSSHKIDMSTGKVDREDTSILLLFFREPLTVRP